MLSTFNMTTYDITCASDIGDNCFKKKKKIWDMLLYSPYISDLAPSDYHLFRAFERSLYK
jgi:hypothetical protein